MNRWRCLGLKGSTEVRNSRKLKSVGYVKAPKTSSVLGWRSHPRCGASVLLE